MPSVTTERRLERAGAEAARGAQAEGRAPNGRAPGEANPWNEERSGTVGVLGRGSREWMHCERQGGDTKARRAPSAPSPQGSNSAEGRSVSRPQGGQDGSPKG